MKLNTATSYLFLALHFMAGAVRSAGLMHADADAREPFGNLRAMRAAISPRLAMRTFWNMRDL